MIHFWTLHHPEASRGKEDVLSVLSSTTSFFLFEAAATIKTCGLSCRVLSYCTYCASDKNKPDTYTCGNETLPSSRENNTSLSSAFVRLSGYHKNTHTPLLYVQKTPHLVTFFNQPALFAKLTSMVSCPHFRVLPLCLIPARFQHRNSEIRTQHPLTFQACTRKPVWPLQHVMTTNTGDDMGGA